MPKHSQPSVFVKNKLRMDFDRRKWSQKYSTRAPYYVQGELYRPKTRPHRVQSAEPQNVYQSVGKEILEEEIRDNVNEVLYRLFLKKNIDISGSIKLGAGRYSKVITARQFRVNNSNDFKMIAIKIINTEKVTAEFKNKFLPREIACWRKLSHPNLVRILGHYEALKYVFLTQEFGGIGDLLKYVQSHGPLPERQSRNWLKQIIQAVEYMHSVGIAHRDLKLENIIVFSKNLVKVGDFGFCREVQGHSQTFCGSKSYSAPEILKGQAYDPFKSDVWSIGVIAFIIVTDTMPFCENIGNIAVVRAQKNQCVFFIDTMLTYEPKIRPNLRKCLRLPFFNDETSRRSL